MNALWTHAAASALSAILLLSPSAVAGVAPAAAPSSVPSTPSPGTVESNVTWSVRPGDSAGPDGRSWVEWETDPGQTRTEHLVVSNFGDREVEFRLTAADGYFTDTGRFSMLPSDQESAEAGTWITLPESVVVPAGGAEIVPFSIRVPADASPGDHPAGVAASILSSGTGAVGVESRVGFRVMTRVTGELRAELATAVTGSYTGSVNPFDPGRLELTYAITNSGNTRVRTHPTVSLAGPFGLTASERSGEEIVDIAPGETRTGTLEVSGAWPLFWYDARVTATPIAVTEDLTVEGARTTSSSVGIAALPLSQLVTLIAALGLLAWFLRQRRRERAKTARLIEEARAEGRAASARPRLGGDAGPRAAEAQSEAPPQDEAPTGGPRVPLRRRDARPSARLVAGLLIGAATLAGAGFSTGDAQAATTRELTGVDVRVEITPAPDPGATSEPTPTPQPSSTMPTTGPGGATPLPPTGGGIDAGLLALGGILVAGGIAAGVAVRARRR
ncbi:hypothetical protein [Microbacterium sp. A1-JK]|uniref:COG1470 family protein n=1 Tax=Microbacterium sp. A1-JK TaxID=3177516 RepID=UPI003889A95C